MKDLGGKLMAFNSQYKPWLNIADLTLQSNQDTQKLKQLEKTFESELGDQGDARERMCMLNEYEVTLDRDMRLSRAPLLKTLTEVHNRMENSLLEELILLQRIDKMCAQVD